MVRERRKQRLKTGRNGRKRRRKRKEGRRVRNGMRVIGKWNHEKGRRKGRRKEEKVRLVTRKWNPSRQVNT